MKIQRISSIFFIAIILILIWKSYDFFNPNFENKFKQNVKELDDNRNELNQMIRLATNEISNQRIPNKEMDLDDVSEELRVKMEDLGFTSFRFEEVNNCGQKFRFFFNVGEGWNQDNLNHVELIYSPCDKETENGFHSFDGNHIDILGAGGNWKILSDTDFI
ncbi:hypothetical protein [Flavobacterium stagni]|uniref:Uncharacterized protein n=1 Tax=Flavobacterium stagni TaxID=2506421 RepID=A0A4Q1K2E8_9FLAO|nr:hypothetical protein [Flavobacterium stagni]RXR18887.1 hypothetical protein EQG61_13595 [Flavobacterium stagni]